MSAWPSSPEAHPTASPQASRRAFSTLTPACGSVTIALAGTRPAGRRHPYRQAPFACCCHACCWCGELADWLEVVPRECTPLTKQMPPNTGCCTGAAVAQRRPRGSKPVHQHPGGCSHRAHPPSPSTLLLLQVLPRWRRAIPPWDKVGVTGKLAGRRRCCAEPCPPRHISVPGIPHSQDPPHSPPHQKPRARANQAAAPAAPTLRPLVQTVEFRGFTVHPRNNRWSRAACLAHLLNSHA